MSVLLCTGLETILKFNVKYNFGPFFSGSNRGWLKLEEQMFAALIHLTSPWQLNAQTWRKSNPDNFGSSAD